MVKRIILVILFILVAPLTILCAISDDDLVRNVHQLPNENVISNSSRFTQQDDLSINQENGVDIRLVESVSDEDKTDGNYDKLLITRGSSELYYNSYLHIFKVKDLNTSYVWSTGVDDFKKENATIVVARQLSSLVILDYYFYNTQDGSYSTTVNTEYLNKVTGTDSYNIAPNNNISIQVNDYKISNEIIGKVLSLNYIKLGIKFNVYVYLDEEGCLNIEVPNDEIEECVGSYKNYIANIRLAPAIGSNVDGTEPGYMLIPDGSGALIRYGQKTMTTKIVMSYYGYDYGINPNNTNAYPQNLILPIYGYVNGINQNGCLAIIENGDYLCDLTINLNGAENSKYNFMTPRFKLRNQYLLYGINQATEDVLTNCDIKIKYLFLNDDANYVGMANVYKEYLMDNDILENKSSGEYKLKLDFLMSEAVKALIGTNVTTMTKLSEVQEILSELNENEIEELLCVMLGWNQSGFSGSTPYNIKYNNKLASKKDFVDFNKNNEVYYYNDYLIGYSKGDYSSRSDVARTLQRLKLTFIDEDAKVANEYEYLYPSSSYEIAKKNINKYQKLGIKNLALDNIGSSVFTTYKNGDVNHKNENVEIYQDLFELLCDNEHNLGLFSPYEYAFKYMKYYFCMPLYSCQCNYYTDNIPFLPYVLRGNVDYYSSYINFFANQNEQMLRSLDYGALPSYIITSGESRELKYTDSYNLYTTVYSHWKDNIINNYRTFKSGYEIISNNFVVSRQVLDSGIVEIIYSDGNSIQIDYNKQGYKVGGENQWIFL